jgi:hypothetical protein
VHLCYITQTDYCDDTVTHHSPFEVIVNVLCVHICDVYLFMLMVCVRIDMMMCTLSKWSDLICIVLSWKMLTLTQVDATNIVIMLWFYRC